MSKVSYAYATARVRVRMSKLLEDADYEKLVNMEVPQITRYLQDTQYEEEIDELGTRYSGATLLEYSLSLNLANRFSSLIDMATGDLKDDIVAYLRRYDVKNLKTLIRGKTYGAEGDEVRENLVPAGDMSQDRLYALEKMPLRDMLTDLKDTRYWPALEPLAAAYEETGEVDRETLSRAENALDTVYYEDLLSRLGPKQTPFSRLVRSEIDYVNVQTILRLKADPHARGLPDEVESLIIEGGTEVRGALLERLADAPDVDSLIETLREEGPWDLPEDLETVSEVGSFVKDRTVEETEAKANRDPLSIAPIIAYILLKQREVDRVRTIARGKEAGMSADEIRELIS